MTTPFAPGQRVYQRSRPESGSLVVDRCEQNSAGDWRVKALDHYAYGLTPISITAPAEHFRACPPSWTEPPPCPAASFGYDAASEIERAAHRADPEYAARLEAWRDAIKARAAVLAAIGG